MNFTPAQTAAIESSGNTLVVAGAGAGKTKTLVERCVRTLLRPQNRISIRNILVVTFTEAAATEVRERIRLRLQSALGGSNDNEWVLQQLAQLDSANISTLHSFCYSLVRENFYLIDLDPAVSVLPQEQSAILFSLTLEDLLREHYENAHDWSPKLQDLVRSHFGGWDQPLRDFVQQVHSFTQTRPDPAGWFETELNKLNESSSSQWKTWHSEFLRTWCQWWVPFLNSLPPENSNAHECARILNEAVTADDFSKVAAQIETREATEFWPKRKKTEHMEPFKSLFTEAAFLASLSSPDAIDPLQQDWDWQREPLRILLQFVQQFSARFSQVKKDRGMVDFNDLEQLSLKLLWDDQSKQPTSLALQWQQKLEAIFVDEYQDINTAQDRIISCLGRPAAGNRFLVGDAKQSIYRFRQANPAIFRTYLQDKHWSSVFLADNFRSHEAILNWINPLFSWLMQEKVGGITYDSNAALQFGASAVRSEMAARPGEPRVHLHLLLKPSKDQSNAEKGDTRPDGENGDSNDGSATSAILELAAAEHEARAIARQLREMKESALIIYDEKEKKHRKVEWRDMVVLLRATKNKAETYAKAFDAVGVPLETKRDGFYTAPEVLDLLNVLHLLDNPLQDVPLLAVLRSPMVGMTATELVEIRLAAPKIQPFWRALKQFRKAPSSSSAFARASRFLERYETWRNDTHCSSLSDRLERILADTAYAQWLLAQPRGQHRYANLQQLLRVAADFDAVRGESLYLFLRYLEQLQERAGDIEPASLAQDNAVRLMTVHQSKGLEFPVVVVADLGKRFNMSEGSGSFLLDDQFGLCSTVRQPTSGERYPSLPLWLARRTQRMEAIGEEIRVLYVALTRAQNHLLLFGTAPRSPKKWTLNATPHPLPQQIQNGSSCLDWIGSFLTTRDPSWMDQSGGTIDHLTYSVHEADTTGQQSIPSKSIEPASLSPEALHAVFTRLEFQYPHLAATRQAAKTSVSALRRASREIEESAPARFIRPVAPGKGQLRGNAFHTLLEHLDLDHCSTPEAVRSQAQALQEHNLLTSEEFETLDPAAIAHFWSAQSDGFLRHRSSIRRELPFTARLTSADLREFGLSQDPLPEDEFILVQGVADLVLLLPDEIWILDFKTDDVSPADLTQKLDTYRPQLKLYALALSRIYRRPVTRALLHFFSLGQTVPV